MQMIDQYDDRQHASRIALEMRTDLSECDVKQINLTHGRRLSRIGKVTVADTASIPGAAEHLRFYFSKQHTTHVQ
jgi:hypothetical protein